MQTRPVLLGHLLCPSRLSPSSSSNLSSCSLDQWVSTLAAPTSTLWGASKCRIKSESQVGMGEEFLPRSSDSDVHSRLRTTSFSNLTCSQPSTGLLSQPRLLPTPLLCVQIHITHCYTTFQFGPFRALSLSLSNKEVKFYPPPISLPVITASGSGA